MALNELIQLESVNRIIILGACLSDAEGLASAVAHPMALVLTTADLIDPARKSSRSLPNGGLHRRDLLVAPRGEMIDDEVLATILNSADQAGARIAIGFATSHRRGVVSNGLAAYAADRLAAISKSPGDPDIKRLLASGIIERPLQDLYAMGRIEFEPLDRDPDKLEARPCLIVCNDRRRRAVINHSAGPIRLETLEECNAVLSHGQWIVWERTDYDRTPPVSAGRLGRVFDRIDEENWLIEFDGALSQFHWTELQSVRPTYAISIDEARRAPRNVELQIQLDDLKYAWASLLLAAAHGESAFVRVRPEVATNITQLIDVTRRSLRGALPSHLFRLSDPNADVREILTAGAHELDCDLTSDLEQFPEPLSNQRADIAETNSLSLHPNLDMRPARYPVHQDLWRIFSSTLEGREALARLEQALSPDAPNRNAEAARLLEIAGEDTPIAHLIAAIYCEGSPARRDTDKAELHEIPGPRAWTPLQLARARYEAFAISYSSQWNLAPVKGDALTRAPK